MEQDQRNVFSSFPHALNQKLEMVNPTYDQHIIKPPDRNKTHGPKIKRMIVDSRERDEELYPDPSSYILNFEHEYRDVISMELSQANIPHSFYNIYHYYDKNGKLYANNLIHLHLITSDSGDLSQTFEMDIGKYTDIGLSTDSNSFLGKLKNLISSISFITAPYFALILNTLDHTNKINISITPVSGNFDKVLEFYLEFLDPNTCPTLNPNVKEPKKYPKYSLGPILGFNKKKCWSV